MSGQEEFLTPEEVPIYTLDVKPSWDKLTEKEKLYAHYFSLASWAGQTIVFKQVSLESIDIFNLLQALFRGVRVADLKSKALAQGSVSEKEFGDFLQYVANFYGNGGNYKSFGDTKFIPRLAASQFELIVHSAGNAVANQLWDKCKVKVYSLEPSERELGLPPAGVSSYYSENITKADIELVQEVLNENKIEAYNTRLFKVDAGLEVRLASAQTGHIATYEKRGVKVNIIRGDFLAEMSQVVAYLEEAKKYAANEHQANMITSYVRHFQTGEINDHKDAQRHWIRDNGPVVETNIGFIESYRDPFGVRGEWEGFVSVVNKETSAKFGVLVDNAPKFIENLPWPKTFEKDSFLRPDFTALEVISFSTSGIPSGINLPNYDDVRQVNGHKNVSLSNVISSLKMTEAVSFLRDDDQELYKDLLIASFSVQVGIHELLGHGSGKLLREDTLNSFNFDKGMIDPLTGKPVASWYKPGETYDSVFLSLGSAMEECRAESCGIYLSTDRDLLKIFGHFDEVSAQNIIYVNWLNMARAGLVGLEFFSPETGKWRQAHMQARFAILRVLLEAGEGLVKITPKDDSDLVVELDRSKIETVGKPAIGRFLTQMMVYKATANCRAATELFAKLTSVDEHFSSIRKIVIDKKKPRKVFVQAQTIVQDGKAELVEFEASPQGMIDSNLARFQ